MVGIADARAISAVPAPKPRTRTAMPSLLRGMLMSYLDCAGGHRELTLLAITPISATGVLKE
jgi:hypothetical protein